MNTNRSSEQTPGFDEPRTRRVSKKDQIRSLYAAGISDVEDLAVITHARPSYVASVLQSEEEALPYFDLYTPTARTMNVYSKYFAGKLGFKDQEIARHSAELIDHYYRQFEFAKDRAGQHHALMMALVMFDRARWTGKVREADVYRRWLLDRLSEAGASETQEASAASIQPPPRTRLPS
jgi:hypothetical protein